MATSRKKSSAQSTRKTPSGKAGAGAAPADAKGLSRNVKASGSDVGAGSAPPASSALIRFGGAAFALLAVLRLIAAQFPEARVWGLNTAAWLPLWMQVALAILGVLAATPALYGVTLRIARLWELLPVRTLAIIAAVLSSVLFWVFRMDTYFLGDGAVYLSEHYRLVRGLEVSGSVLYSLGSAPFTGWLLAQGSELIWDMGGAMAENAHTVFWLGGAIAGFVYVLMIHHFAGRYSEHGLGRLAFVSVLLFTPATLFFFGYVEYYTFSFVGIAATVWLSMEVARGRMSVYWLLPVFAVTLAFHLLAVALLPGILFAILARNPKTEMLLSRRNILIVAAASLVLGGLYYFLSGVAFEGSRVILSLQPFGEEGAVQRYTLLSAAHLIDVPNMLLFVGAQSLLVWLLLRNASWDQASLVGFTHVLFTFFLLFFGSTSFGMARDWDINAYFGVVLALYILMRLRSEERRRRDYLLYLLTWGTLLAVLPWLLVNLDTGRSEQRFRHIMALDDEHITGDFALNGYEHLRKYYQSIDSKEDVAWAIRKKIEMVGYPDDFRKYALAVIEGIPAGERPAHYAWMFSELRARLRLMKETGRERLYEGDWDTMFELSLELLIQLGQLPRQQGEIDALFRREIEAFRGLAGGHVLIDLAVEQYAWDRGDGFPGSAVFTAAADEVQTSGTLAFYA
ncbi:MAG: hypothetical protein KFH87_05630, partial [Bacteroidetes bacterium]|nr:hypothetical protein [Bacteroidota bacterium]